MAAPNERKVSLVGVNGWFVSARLNDRGDLIIAAAVSSFPRVRQTVKLGYFKLVGSG